MRVIFIALATALNCASPLLAQSTPSTDFSAVGNWHVDFEGQSCAASREFTNADDSVVLIARSYMPGRQFDFQIVSKTLAPQTHNPSVQFVPAEKVAEKSSYYAKIASPDGWKGVALLGDRPPSPVGLSGLEVTGVYRQKLMLQTGPLDALFQSIAECEDRLLTALGLDAVAHHKLARQAEIDWDDSSWLSVTAPMQRDFSRKGSKFQQVALSIDEQGRAFGCQVVSGNVDEKIAKRMCDAILPVARLAPALDAGSQPIKSYYLLTLAAITG